MNRRCASRSPGTMHVAFRTTRSRNADLVNGSQLSVGRNALIGEKARHLGVNLWLRLGANRRSFAGIGHLYRV